MAFALPVLAAVTAISGGLQAFGEYQEAQDEAQRLEFEAQVDNRNAKLARQSAASEANDERIENRRKLGQIRASYAANGVGGAGTSLDVLEDYTREGEFEAAKIRYNGEVRAIGLEDSAAQKSSAAKGTKSRAGFSLAVGLLGGGLSGANVMNRRTG